MTRYIIIGSLVTAAMLASSPALRALGGCPPDQAGVAEAVICTAVEDLSPSGANTQFFERVDRLYCFTRIEGCAPGDTISHVWYFGEDEKARVRLPVRSASWRTWSSKRMMDAWSGAWRVDILGPRGEVLETLEFVYKPVEAGASGQE